MARSAADRAKAVWTGTGSGTITLGGAAPGEAVQAFPSSLDGQIVPYLIMHETAQEAEAGYGLYTHSGTTLSRLYRYYPTPGGAAVAFSPGTKFVSPTVISAHVVPNIATTDPTVNDDVTSGFLRGMFWINTTTPAVFVCRSHTDGAASWAQIDGAGAGAVGFGDLTGAPSDNEALQDELDAKAALSHTQDVSTITGGTDGQLMGWGTDDIGEPKEAAAYQNPVQISSGEKTAGTETAIRSLSPADVKEMSALHGGGGGTGGLAQEDNAGTAVTLNNADFGKLYDFTSDSAIAITLDAQASVPGVASAPRMIGIRKGGAGAITVSMESGAGYFVAGDDYGGSKATASFTVTGFAWVEIRSNSDGNSSVWIVGGDTNLAKTVNGAVTFSSPLTMGASATATFGAVATFNAAADFNSTVNVGGTLTLDGSAIFDAGGKVVHSNLAGVVTGVSGLLTVAAHLGRMVVTTGNITIPLTTGFHCFVEAGGAHTITFNSTVTAAATTGQVCSVIVRSATVVKISPWTTTQTLS